MRIKVLFKVFFDKIEVVNYEFGIVERGICYDFL